MGIQEVKFWVSCGEKITVESCIRITNVLGGQRQLNLLLLAVAVLPCKHVKQHKEAGLAAVGQGDVLGAYIPAKLAAQ